MGNYWVFPASYLLGAVPFGLIVVRLWKGVDLREYGSGNIGTTNVARLLGPVAWATVFPLDVLKGVVPVLVCQRLFPAAPGGAVIGGLLAILGHNYSPFLRFRGGRGVATSLGVVLGLDWRVALLAFLLWGLVVKVTRYVSVGSMVGGVAVPCLLAAFRDPWEYVAFGVVGAAFILWRHRPNLQRLRAGTEPQIGQRVEVPKMSEEEVKTEPPP